MQKSGLIWLSWHSSPQFIDLHPIDTKFEAKRFRVKGSGSKLLFTHTAITPQSAEFWAAPDSRVALFLAPARLLRDK
jgi:hypothetical protein